MDVLTLPEIAGVPGGGVVAGERREKDIDFFGCLIVIYSQLSVSASFLI